MNTNDARTAEDSAGDDSRGRQSEGAGKSANVDSRTSDPAVTGLPRDDPSPIPVGVRLVQGELVTAPEPARLPMRGTVPPTLPAPPEHTDPAMIDLRRVVSEVLDKAKSKKLPSFAGISLARLRELQDQLTSDVVARPLPRVSHEPIDAGDGDMDDAPQSGAAFPGSGRTARPTPSVPLAWLAALVIATLVVTVAAAVGAWFRPRPPSMATELSAISNKLDQHAAFGQLTATERQELSTLRRAMDAKMKPPRPVLAIETPPPPSGPDPVILAELAAVKDRLQHWVTKPAADMPSPLEGAVAAAVRANLPKTISGLAPAPAPYSEGQDVYIVALHTAGQNVNADLEAYQKLFRALPQDKTGPLRVGMILARTANLTPVVPLDSEATPKFNLGPPDGTESETPARFGVDLKGMFDPKRPRQRAVLVASLDCPPLDTREPGWVELKASVVLVARRPVEKKDAETLGRWQAFCHARSGTLTVVYAYADPTVGVEQLGTHLEALCRAR